MSSEIAIEVENLSKAYPIYRRPSDRLRQAILPRANRLLHPLTSLGLPLRVPSVYYEEHWALRSLSFTVGRGSSVGIIGRNGSGKSTLLQLVCGTLRPTTGSAHTKGRIAALLELGSGFNPEFTGRENIYLNASILGMSREETEARIDQIIEFADIGEYVEQPVRTYSSGMAMRLAFAVIAHVDAEILIIDEALAVGDAYFQHKCLRWLRNFRETGTVLFCGHDGGAIMALCDRGIWLDRGEMMLEGTAKEVAEAYSASIMMQTRTLPKAAGKSPAAEPEASQSTVPPEPSQVSKLQTPAGNSPPAEPEASQSIVQPEPVQVSELRALPPAPKSLGPVLFDTRTISSSIGTGDAEMEETRLTYANGEPLGWITGGEKLMLAVSFRAVRSIDAPIIGFIVKDRLGQAILGDNTFFLYVADGLYVAPQQNIRAKFVFTLPNLMSGRYSLTVACASGTLENHVIHHWIHDVLMFDVHSAYRNGVLIALEMQEISLEVGPLVDAAKGEDYVVE